MHSTCVYWALEFEDRADAKKILQASDFLQQDNLRSWKLVDEEIILQDSDCLHRDMSKENLEWEGKRPEIIVLEKNWVG